ncbi:hypothetical protein NB693_20385 [Pantoea ananatis]|uniref:hypothetical protein n=1 Tax=Pantoea ananas TaxID=553 RepID=UPI00221EA445|nr:hypothetical protein [Pantoea ananatis]
MALLGVWIRHLHSLLGNWGCTRCQTAMMVYKKEMPIFFALYWVLVVGTAAPWFAWTLSR